MAKRVLCDVRAQCCTWSQLLHVQYLQNMEWKQEVMGITEPDATILANLLFCYNPKLRTNFGDRWSERRNIQFSHLQKKSRVKMRIVKLSEVFIFGIRPNQSKIAWSEFLFICFSSFLSIYIVVKAYQVKFMTLDFGCVQFRNMHSHYCKIDFWNFLLLQNWNSRAIEHEFPLLQLLAITILLFISVILTHLHTSYQWNQAFGDWLTSTEFTF